MAALFDFLVCDSKNLVEVCARYVLTSPCQPTCLFHAIL